MNGFMKGVFIGLLILGLLPDAGYSCTTFRIDHDNQYYFGRNFDWMIGDALLIVNKRGVAKTAILFPGDKARPASWTSRYGSVTFNHYGRGFSTGGMNEAGLVVETMGLLDSEYPAGDARPGLKSMQWRQYQLDNHATVDEVIDSDSKIRLLRYRNKKTPGAHYLISDRRGKCAAIEFLDGKMVVHTGEAMPVMALTNTRYADSVKYWKKGSPPEPDTWMSVTRFIIVADMVSEYGVGASGSPVEHAFDILSAAAHPVKTRWSIVYDQNNLRFHFITDANKNIRTVDMNKFDYSCRTKVRALDVNADLSGDVTDKFRDYTDKINQDLIDVVYKNTYFFKSLPPKTLDIISRFPNSTTCVE